MKVHVIQAGRCRKAERVSVEPADTKFHARHDAVARSYIYQISRRRTAFAISGKTKFG